jgi:ESAT-6 family protein
MSQILYNYPAMLAHSADMSGYAGTRRRLAAVSQASRPHCSQAGKGTPA